MAFFRERDRNIIPRWRDFRTTIAIGELTPAGAPPSEALPGGDFLAEKITAWRDNRTASFASELVGAAFFLGRQAEAEEAAKFLLSNGVDAPGPARALAGRLLRLIGGSVPAAAPPEAKPVIKEQVYGRIHRLRRRLREDPRNAILLVDLAREYTLLGLEEKALNAMGLALKLSPTNRFVLRAAARMYVHYDREDLARRILLRADSTPHDPWLIAAEAAVASKMGRSPEFVRAARRMLEDASFSPAQVSELAGAMGTLEFINGRTQAARKLFRKSLITPTDNSVAQAEWAARHQVGIEVSPTELLAPRVYEARAWDYHTRHRWRETVEESWRWLHDQPFSETPALFGSFVAGSVLDDHMESERIVRVSMLANPTETSLINNLAFSLAMQGRIAEAELELAKVRLEEVADHRNKITLAATTGLIRFRRGDAERGRELYLSAYENAKGPENVRYRAAAAFHLAREEMLAGTTEMQRAMERADQAVKALGHDDDDIRVLYARIRDMWEQRRHDTLITAAEASGSRP